MSIVSVLHKIEHAVIFEVLTTKMAGRVAFGEKTKYLFRQREETIMGIAMYEGKISMFSSNRHIQEMGAIEGKGVHTACDVA